MGTRLPPGGLIFLMHLHRTDTQQNIVNRRLKAICLVSLLFFAPVLPVLTGLALASPVLAAEAAEPVPYQPELEIDLSAFSAIAVETGRMQRLYAKNADVRMNIPGASKVMTALLACERLPLDTPITISKVAAAAAALESTGDDVKLFNGDKYPLEYLLLRLVFYNSDAAALAIAEQISGIEDTFVELMNAKAVGYELVNTVFRNSTGEPAYEPEERKPTGSPPPDGGLPDIRDPLQYTTASDLARLVSIAMLDENFAKIIRKDSEMLILNGEKLVSMRNAVQSIWTLSENQVAGAFYSENQTQSFMITVGKVKDIGLVMITAAGSMIGRISDTLKLIDTLADTYVQTRLVDAGEGFTVEKEQTTDGEVFGLIYKKTILYVHPANDNFLRRSVIYNSFGPHRRPIELGMTVGQVVFELTDGTVIAADVSPDRQILSRITLINQALNILQNNDNLLFVLMITCILLMMWMMVLVLRRLIRLIRLQVLLRLEKHSRR